MSASIISGVEIWKTKAGYNSTEANIMKSDIKRLQSEIELLKSIPGLPPSVNGGRSDADQSRPVIVTPQPKLTRMGLLGV